MLDQRPWWGRIAVGLTVLVVLLVLVERFSLLPGFGGLFGEETRDRSGPALLKSVQDMERYEAAVGTFQVVVDLTVAYG